MPVPHYQKINSFIQYDWIDKLIGTFYQVPKDRWQPGRQGTGYLKYEITSHKDEWYYSLVMAALGHLGYTPSESEEPRFDAWFMRMPDGAYIHPHTDPCPFDAGEHHRLNMCIRSAERGGNFSIEGQQIPIHTGEALLFRPDAMRHEVSMVSGADRLMISVGCIKEKR